MRLGSDVSMTHDEDCDLDALRADPEGILPASFLMSLLGESEARERFAELVQIHIRGADFEPALPPEPRRRAARQAAAAVLIAMAEARGKNHERD